MTILLSIGFPVIAKVVMVFWSVVADKGLCFVSGCILSRHYLLSDCLIELFMAIYCASVIRILIKSFLFNKGSGELEGY